MITVVEDIPGIAGIRADLDETSMPLGTALSTAGLAQYYPDKLQRIPGVVAGGGLSNASGGVKHSFLLRIGTTEYVVAIVTDGSNNARFYRTDGTEITGTALTNMTTGFYANIWTSCNFLGARYVTGGAEPIQKITNATTRSDLTGTPTPPKGHLIASYLGRLYVAGVETVPGGTAASDVDRSRVFFTGSLTETFDANYFLYVDTIPGPITALAINSPTSAAGTIIGELVIAKLSGIAKLSSDPGNASATLDVVSDVVGSDAPHTFANTPIGLIFVGRSGSRYSIYHLPLGSQGEPIDIGYTISPIFNSISSLKDSYAVYHDGFYKLFYTDSIGPAEIWFSVLSYIREKKIKWFGVHRRGVYQAPVVTEDTKKLYIFGVLSGAGYWFFETKDGLIPADGTFKADGTAHAVVYRDANSNIIPAVLDMPLNIYPYGEEKIFDLVRLYVSKDTNKSNNGLSASTYIDGHNEGSNYIKLYDSNSPAGTTIDIPLVGTNGANVSGISARIRLEHKLDMNFDVLRMSVQYLSHRRRELRNEPA